MCSSPDPPKPIVPPAPARRVDAAVLRSRAAGINRYGRGGFIGTVTNPGGVSGAANVVRNALSGGF